MPKTIAIRLPSGGHFLVTPSARLLPPVIPPNIEQVDPGNLSNVLLERRGQWQRCLVQAWTAPLTESLRRGVPQQLDLAFQTLLKRIQIWCLACRRQLVEQPLQQLLHSIKRAEVSLQVGGRLPALIEKVFANRSRSTWEYRSVCGVDAGFQAVAVQAEKENYSILAAVLESWHAEQGLLAALKRDLQALHFALKDVDIESKRVTVTD